MLYTWSCSQCKQITEVVRALADYEYPPDGGCEHCGCDELQRVITRPAGLKGFVLEGDCWERDGYRMPTARPKRRRDGFG